MEPKIPTPTPPTPPTETDVIKEIKQHYENEIKRLEDEKNKEIAKLNEQIEAERKHHVEVVREILSTGNANLVKREDEDEDEELTEEQQIEQNLLKKYKI